MISALLAIGVLMMPWRAAAYLFVCFFLSFDFTVAMFATSALGWIYFWRHHA